VTVDSIGQVLLLWTLVLIALVVGRELLRGRGDPTLAMATRAMGYLVGVMAVAVGGATLALAIVAVSPAPATSPSPTPVPTISPSPAPPPRPPPPPPPSRNPARK
jgi:hypothetical protein